MDAQIIRLTLPETEGGLHTEYIQRALDRVRDKGGEVILSDGEWRIGSVRMYSNTTLRLSGGTKPAKTGGIMRISMSPPPWAI